MHTNGKTLGLSALALAGALASATPAMAATCSGFFRPVSSYTDGPNYTLYAQADRASVAAYAIYVNTTNAAIASALQAALTGDKVVWLRSTNLATCPDLTTATGFVNFGTVANFSTYR